MSMIKPESRNSVIRFSGSQISHDFCNKAADEFGISTPEGDSDNR